MTDADAQYIFGAVNEFIKQTTPLLLDALFCQVAYLLFPEASKWRRPMALVLFLTAIGIAILVYGPVLKTPLPSPLPFAFVALVASALAAGLHRYRHEALLTRSAAALADRLDDFAQDCRARLGGPFSLPSAERQLKQRAAHDEYLTRFSAEIRSIHRALTINDPVFANNLESMLGAVDNPTLQLPGLATWVASSLRTEATALKRPWLDLKVLPIFSAYLGLAIALWLALWLMAHK